MTLHEIDDILAALLCREHAVLDPPSDKDWDALEMKFQCRFGDDFRNFIALMATYCFPGDIFNVSRGRTNGNDPIHLVYDSEVANNPHWLVDMIPFYGIGNGDYFCLNRRQCPQSQVHYYYADRGDFEVYSRSFEDWITRLPDFLA